MTNIVNFPKKEKRPAPLLRQRVFYIGFRYVGPFLCQGIQNLYLKRKGLKHGDRWWAMITYGKYDESYTKEYSIELEECFKDDVPDMLDMFDVAHEVSFDELESMDWRGSVMYSAKIKSIFHKCYDGLRFLDFAIPLKANQFGYKVMMQSEGAKGSLYLEPKHSFVILNNGDDDWVWMNLETFHGQEVEAVPIRLKEELPDNFTKDFLIKQNG